MDQLLHPAYQHTVTRKWVTKLPSKSNLVYPVFVVEGEQQEQPIASMQGIRRFSVDRLIPFLKPLVEMGLQSIIIFGVVEESEKDEQASRALDCCVHRALNELKVSFPLLLLITDVCLCAYTTHGHCGILNANGDLDNAASIKRLAEVAVSHAKAGADMVAPSDMMDGRVLAIKQLLRQYGMSLIPVMAYKQIFYPLNTALYGPFRDVCQSKPSGRGRETYQLPSGSRELAMRAVQRDLEEGADFVMVKPISAYLDVAYEIKQRFPYAITACYQVSGEYAMICNAADAGLVDKKRVVLEYMTSFTRAGIDVIITYFTPELLEWL